MDPNNNSVNPDDTVNANAVVGGSVDPGDTDLESIANDVALSANDEPVVTSYETPTLDETTSPQLTDYNAEAPTESQTEALYDPNTYAPGAIGTDSAGSENIDTNEPVTEYAYPNPLEYATADPNETPLPDYQSMDDPTPLADQYAPATEIPVDDNATAENVMQEFNTSDNGNVASLDPSPLSPPEKPAGKHTAIIPLVIITILLFALLLGSIWFFFLRGEDEGPQPTPTPGRTPTAIPTQGTTDTHLECRFGLCVEVPGTGEDICSSSFDCEQATLSPTTAPITTPSTAPTTAPLTATPTAAAPTGTISPTPAVRPSTSPTTNPTTQPTTLPTPSPTPIANTLPDSGTTEMTLLFSGLFLLALGAGFALLRKH